MGPTSTFIDFTFPLTHAFFLNRRIPRRIRLCPSRLNRVPLPGWRLFSPLLDTNVRKAEPALGEYVGGVHCAGVGADSCCID